MMVLLIAMGGLLLLTMRPEAVSAEEEEAKLLAQIASLKARVGELEKLNLELNQAILELRRLLDEKNKQLAATNALLSKKEPPIIEMADVTSMSFALGSAELGDAFSKILKEKYFPQFVKILEQYEVVDTIEIIGHTDRSPVSKATSLDSKLILALQGELDVKYISPGSNADLGLMRSLAILQAWKAWISQQNVPDRIRNVNLRTYSAAYSVLPGKPPSDNGTEESKLENERFDGASRRIEVRFTRLKQR